MILNKRVTKYILSIFTLIIICFALFISNVNVFKHIINDNKYINIHNYSKFRNKLIDLSNNNNFNSIKNCLTEKTINFNVEYLSDTTKILSINSNKDDLIESCLKTNKYDIYDKPKITLSDVSYIHTNKKIDKSYYHLDYLTSSTLKHEYIFKKPIKSYCCKYGINCPLEDQCIYTFVVDTGVIASDEFEEIIDKQFEYPINHNDNVGHGTFCASVINSKSHGINPNTIITSIKLLETSSTENIQHIINVFNHLIMLSNGPCSPSKKCIVNMSFVDKVDGQSILIKLMRDLYNTNSFILISSAGNYASDACVYSPGNLNEVINIGSIRMSLFGPKISKFSNYGNCVDFWFFGEDIKGLDNMNNIVYMSGTSMTAPIASSIISLYLSSYPNANYQDIFQYLELNSKKCLITNLDKNSDKRNFILSLDQSKNQISCQLIYSGEIIDRK